MRVIRSLERGAASGPDDYNPNMTTPLWTPSDVAIRISHLHRFREFAIRECGGRPGDSYESLHRWSLHHRGTFWTAMWKYANVIGTLGDVEANPESAFVPGPHMTDARWFPGAELNFAENLLKPADCSREDFADSVAVISRTEQPGSERALTRRELLNRVTAFGSFLRSRGVRAGDRVAGVVANTPEAIIAMLGATAIGAVWSSCSPDFGEDAIHDRFSQIEPVVLVSTDQAFYNGKRTDVLAKTEAVLAKLPTVRTFVVTAKFAGGELPKGWFSFEIATRDAPQSFTFERFAFDHPGFILYSSGTTGAPKCIVHGTGGTLLQHLKEHQLHSDVRAGDRVFYFTTTGWMMWNWLVSALGSRAAIVLYDGSPLHPSADVLWELAARVGVTQFGASAKYYAHLDKVGVKPREQHDLSPLRVVLSTGSPLLPESFDYIYRDVKADVCLASISGGTDIVSCFALGCPTHPVYRGELQVKGLGLDVQILDADGKPIVGEPGELVCASPFPCMPIYFWNDPGKAKYLASYFSVFPNVWCHGDWAEETPTGGFIIFGRSDTTLKPGGVRIGTAEIYQQVESFPDILESLATGLRRDGDEQIVLFIRMKPGKTLDASLIADLKQRLRTHTSPRHVPAFVLEVPDLPRTISGKISEVAVRNIINNLPLKNTAALANPESLAFFRNCPELQQSK